MFNVCIERSAARSLYSNKWCRYSNEFENRRETWSILTSRLDMNVRNWKRRNSSIRRNYIWFIFVFQKICENILLRWNNGQHFSIWIGMKFSLAVLNSVFIQVRKKLTIFTLKWASLIKWINSLGNANKKHEIKSP